MIRVRTDVSPRAASLTVWSRCRISCSVTRSHQASLSIRGHQDKEVGERRFTDGGYARTSKSGNDGGDRAGMADDENDSPHVPTDRCCYRLRICFSLPRLDGHHFGGQPARRGERLRSVASTAHLCCNNRLYPRVLESSCEGLCTLCPRRAQRRVIARIDAFLGMPDEDSHSGRTGGFGRLGSGQCRRKSYDGCEKED